MNVSFWALFGIMVGLFDKVVYDYSRESGVPLLIDRTGLNF